MKTAETAIKLIQEEEALKINEKRIWIDSLFVKQRESGAQFDRKKLSEEARETYNKI